MHVDASRLITPQAVRRLEMGFLGDLIASDHDTAALVDHVLKIGLTDAHFADPGTRAAFKALHEKGSCDPAVLQQRLIEVSGFEFADEAIQSTSVSLEQACERARVILETGLKRQAKEKVQALFARMTALSPAELGALIQHEGGALASLASYVRESDTMSLSDVPDAIPEEENPNALFANGWLRKGHAAVLVSVSGSGKSVLSMQLALAWAAGEEIFGIRPVRPLRIGIVQTEDDIEELADFRQSMRRGFVEQLGWPPEKINAAERQIEFCNMRGLTGSAFATRMGVLQAERRFDLIIMNPLQAFTDFDISTNSDLSRFLRGDLNGMMKAYEWHHPAKCGLLIIHHTNKAPSGPERRGWGTDAYAEYVGAGGAELTNWMRAMLTLMPCVQPGFYYLTAAKRGGRLKWRDAADNPTNKRVIAYTQGYMFWREPEPDEIAALPGMGAAKKSEPKAAPDVKADAKELAEELKANACTLTEARKLARTLFVTKRQGEKAYDEIVANLPLYGIVLMPTGRSTERLIGSSEGCGKLFSRLMGKRMPFQPA